MKDLPSIILITGATGMLGQAFMRQVAAKGGTPVGLARSTAEICVDITDREKTLRALDTVVPDCIINTAALVNLAQCETEPDKALALNAQAPGVLAKYCNERNIPLVQISTDHFFTGDVDKLHTETDSTTLMNEYARSKHAGEVAAMRHRRTLVVRTNVTGWRGDTDRPTFIEWVVASIRNREPMTLFTDYYTSTLDADTCAATVLDLIQAGHCGITNVASRNCLNKKDFVSAVSREMGMGLHEPKTGSVRALSPPRAESCGLDVGLVENLLQRRLPDSDEVIRALLNSEPKR